MLDRQNLTDVPIENNKIKKYDTKYMYFDNNTILLLMVIRMKYQMIICNTSHSTQQGLNKQATNKCIAKIKFSLLAKFGKGLSSDFTEPKYYFSAFL